MEFGIWTPLPHSIRPEARMKKIVAQSYRRGDGLAKDDSFPFATEVLIKGEEVGFSFTLVAQRYLGPDPDAWVLASALAAATSKINILVAVHPGIVSPQHAAKMGASLDRISNGRFSLNIVNGWNKPEFDEFGGDWLDYDDMRYLRTREFAEIVKGMWNEREFSYQGVHYQLDAVHLPLKPVQTPHPLLYAASGSRKGKEVIARVCDACFVSYRGEYDHRGSFQEKVDFLKNEVDEVRDLAEGFNRCIKIGASAHVAMADSDEKAFRLADEFDEYGKSSRYAKSAASSLSLGLIGSPETLREKILMYQDAGLDFLLLHFHPMIEGMERFSNEVYQMPRLPADQN